MLPKAKRMKTYSKLLPAATLVAMGVATAAPRAFAGGTLTTLASFNGTNGARPGAGLTLSGSTLYGTTTKGGAHNRGTVFSVPIAGGAPAVLVNFNGTNGANPVAPLTLSGNTLYGTTPTGGTNNDGTVFSVPVTGGAPTILVNFNGPNGNAPMGHLTVSGSTLYGTTYAGGSDINSDGTVFSVPIAGGTPTTLVSFGAVGFKPAAGLTLSGNTLYGTTNYGGAKSSRFYLGMTVSQQSNAGTVFSVPIAGGTPTTLASFNIGHGINDGCYPCTGLTLSGSTLYGTTPTGGTNNDGTVFSVPVTGGADTILVNFNGPNGASPEGSLTLSGGTLYGTTTYGGANHDGTVFSVPITGGAPTILASFNGTNGKYPADVHLILSGSTLYGTTTKGGANNDGTVFAITIPEPTIPPKAKK